VGNESKEEALTVEETEKEDVENEFLGIIYPRKEVQVWEFESVLGEAIEVKMSTKFRDVYMEVRK